jgi:hypothetical protein
MIVDLLHAYRLRSDSDSHLAKADRSSDRALLREHGSLFQTIAEN